MNVGQMLEAAQEQGAVASSVSWTEGVLTILLSAPSAVAAGVAETLDLQPAGPDADVGWHSDSDSSYIALTQTP